MKLFPNHDQFLTFRCVPDLKRDGGSVSGLVRRFAEGESLLAVQVRPAAPPAAAAAAPAPHSPGRQINRIKLLGRFFG